MLLINTIVEGYLKKYTGMFVRVVKKCYTLYLIQPSTKFYVNLVYKFLSFFKIFILGIVLHYYKLSGCFLKPYYVFNAFYMQSARFPIQIGNFIFHL